MSKMSEYLDNADTKNLIHVISDCSFVAVESIFILCEKHGIDPDLAALFVRITISTLTESFLAASKELTQLHPETAKDAEDEEAAIVRLAKRITEERLEKIKDLIIKKEEVPALSSVDKKAMN